MYIKLYWDHFKNVSDVLCWPFSIWYYCLKQILFLICLFLVFCYSTFEYMYI